MISVYLLLDYVIRKRILSLGCSHYKVFRRGPISMAKAYRLLKPDDVLCAKGHGVAIITTKPSAFTYSFIILLRTGSSRLAHRIIPRSVR